MAILSLILCVKGHQNLLDLNELNKHFIFELSQFIFPVSVAVVVLAQIVNVTGKYNMADIVLILSSDLLTKCYCLNT